MRPYILLGLGLIYVADAVLGGETSRNLPIQQDLLFYLSFDRSADADFARGNGKVIAPPAKGLVAGKIGSGMRFHPNDGARVCEYAAAENIRPDQGTVAFHFKPDWSGEEYKSRYFFFYPGAKNNGAGANFQDTLTIHTMKYQKPEQEIWLWLDDHGGGNNTVHAAIASWQAGEWHHVAVTWDSQWIQIFLDGELRGRKPLRGLITEPGERFFVGTGRGGYASVEGVMDEFCIYGRPLSQNEIGILTGRPELLAPRIQSVTLFQKIFFQSERVIPLSYELAGLIDPKIHRVEVKALRQGEGVPIAISGDIPPLSGRHSIRIAKPLPEGDYALQLLLLDQHGKELSKGITTFHVILGPFDGRKE